MQHLKRQCEIEKHLREKFLVEEFLIFHLRWTRDSRLKIRERRVWIGGDAVGWGDEPKGRGLDSQFFVDFTF